MLLRPENEELEDIFIPPTKINRALDGDTVIVELQKSRGEHRGKVEGEVKSIEKHSVTQVVGTYSEAKHFGFVILTINVLCKIYLYLKDRVLEP